MNVAGLYGFFRPGPTEPKNLVSGWPAILAALALIVAVGYVAVLRDAAHRRNGLAILAAGVAGYFLALGNQGPTGGPFRLAYEHVPGFVMMREPDKFAVLVALAYAYGFGWGIAWLTTRSRQKVAQVAAVGLAMILPLAYTPNLLGGLGGQVKASELPSSWSIASRLAGQDTVLFLPWHEYFPTPFTDQRMIANPAAFYFAGTVVTSQNPGPGYAFAAEDPEHVFLDKILGPPVDRQRTRVALADLGVRFVALAKVNDWRDFARLVGAPGIRLVYSSPSLDLLSVRPTAQETRDDRRIRSLDLADYRVLPGHPGVVALPVPYSQGWTLDGHPAVRLADGQAGILAPARGGVVHYGPSGGVLASEIGSSRRHLPSQASHSSSGEGGHSAVLIRIIGRWESVLTQTDGELQTALLLQNDGGCLATKDREAPGQLSITAWWRRQRQVLVDQGNAGLMFRPRRREHWLLSLMGSAKTKVRDY